MTPDPTTLEAEHLAEWEEQLQDLIDQTLPAAATIQLHVHLGSCLICTRALRRLLALEVQLRQAVREASPSAGFNQRLFENIKAMENRRRIITVEREKADYLERMTRARNNWRAQLRFHLGNVVAGIATLAAVTSTVVSTWSSESATPVSWLGKAFSIPYADLSVAWLAHPWLASLSGVVAVVAVGIAAALYANDGFGRRIS